MYIRIYWHRQKTAHLASTTLGKRNALIARNVIPAASWLAGDFLNINFIHSLQTAFAMYPSA